MSSKRRLRRKSCTGKHPYPTAEAAGNAMFRMLRLGKLRAGFVHVYKCKFAKHYHFGHAPGAGRIA